MAARSQEPMVLGRSNSGIVGSNPAQGMDEWTHFPMLCFTVYTEALRWTHLSSKESYKNVYKIYRFRSELCFVTGQRYEAGQISDIAQVYELDDRAFDSR
jgi:hypothetical protein